MQQAAIEIGSWLRSHLTDPSGTLSLVLHRQIKGSELLLKNFERPLDVLASYCQGVLDSDELLMGLVREADVEWRQLMGETPYFDTEGASFHPEDPFTVESVRRALSALIQQLSLDGSQTSFIGRFLHATASLSGRPSPTQRDSRSGRIRCC